MGISHDATPRQLARQPDGGSEERYIGVAELRQRFPVADMTIWRWIRDPAVGFPAPVKLGKNGRNYWWLPAILAWQRSRHASEAA